MIAHCYFPALQAVNTVSSSAHAAAATASTLCSSLIVEVE